MAFDKSPVARSADYVRVQALPVRKEGDYPADLVGKMTRALKTSGGTQVLRDVQARALYDLWHHRKGFFPIRVGGGKTLISFLAPKILDAKRPLLLLPAKLIEKTQREWREAAKDWKVAKHLQFMSYEILGRASGATRLETKVPDLIMADEAHKLKSPRAAVTRRVTRFMQAHPLTMFVPMSGTIMKSSIKDFAHLLQWSHGQMSPLPLYAETLTEWSEALDEGANMFVRRDPGILLDLFEGAFDDDGACGDDNARRARRVFFARAQATPGIVMADSKDQYTGSLLIEPLEYDVNAATEANFKKLREEMCRPDGWALSEAMQAWAVARQLSLGLHYAWDPPAPQEWLDARKAWAVFVRDFLGSPRSQAMGIDSEFTCMKAVLGGDIEDKYDVLGEWRRIKPTFTVNSVEVWHDHSALIASAAWLAKHPNGICWVEHVFFGQALSKMTGVPYYGPQGLDARGNFIEAHPAGSPIIASIAANSEGRNIQAKFWDNLMTAPAADSERWEQVLGRTHRKGQLEDTVTMDVLVGCREHLESVPRALNSSDVKTDLFGFTQKLRLADITWPDLHDPTARKGFRWA